MTPLATYIVETLFTLLAVIALAVVVLYGARRAGMGRPGGPLTLVGRLPLDGRRTVYLVRVGAQLYVLGASESGLTKLGELPSDSLELSLAPPESESFRSALARVLGRKREANEKSADDG